MDGEADGRWNFRKNGPLLSNKAQADTRLLPDLAAELELQSLMVAPITRGPKILGLLAVADRIGRAPFSDDDLNLLLALAGQATIAVENLRLHDEIKKANALLQEYDRLKSEFVGIVAHDFRRPLMAIRGFAELVLEEQDLPPETRQEFMRTVISETDHLALLANDTLLITQIETGPAELQLPRGGRGARSCSRRSPWASPTTRCSSTCRPGFPRIWADPDRLRQTLSNLVSNAVKYSPTGGSIVVRVRERGTQHIVIEVVDHGLGIPPEQVGKLFQKFARVRSEDHLKVSGTGLGLYICRLIVEGHGGQIWVESELGRGSTFGMSLPIDARLAQRPLLPVGEGGRRLPRRPSPTPAPVGESAPPQRRFRSRSTSERRASIVTGGLRCRPAREWKSITTPGSLSTWPVRIATTDSERRIRPSRTSRRVPATAAAEAGSQPIPAASTTALASRISRSVTDVTRPRVSRIVRTARSWLAGSPMRIAVATVSASTR